MIDTHTPLPLIRKWGRIAPGCYSALDRCRGAKDSGEMAWPDWCELPISAAYTYMVYNLEFSDLQAADAASELTACWIWRRSRIVYAFDPALTQALTAQAEDITDDYQLPADLLLHLPYPCIYVVASLWEDSPGFFAWMEYDERRPDQPELRLQFVASTMEHSVGTVLHLIPGGTLRDCIRSTAKVCRDNGIDGDVLGADEIRLQLQAIQLLLYLASSGAETQRRPCPKPRKKTGGGREKPPKIIDVGLRIGAALRKSRTAYDSGTSTGGGSSKRPHARRGHWHHYWSGPRDNRQLILKWTAPTFIHADRPRESNIVVFPVKKES